MDTIILSGIRALGSHGVLPEEQARPQPFEVDVELSVDLAPAGRSDVLSDTIDYDALAGRVGIVSERIDPATGKGRVLVEGEDWRAASLMDAALEPGTRVMVVRVEGATLYVDKET